jgi:hypothetical protein
VARGHGLAIGGLARRQWPPRGRRATPRPAAPTSANAAKNRSPSATPLALGTPSGARRSAQTPSLTPKPWMVTGTIDARLTTGTAKSRNSRGSTSPAPVPAVRHAST